MTIIYGEKIEVLAIDPELDMATCRISMVEIDGRDMELNALIPTLSSEEGKKLRKELARQKAKAEKQNPSMATKVTSKFGGYGGSRDMVLPMWNVLTGREKQELRNIRRRIAKGHMEELKRYYGTAIMEEILAKFYERIKKTPRIRRVVGIDAAGCLQLELKLQR